MDDPVRPERPVSANGGSRGDCTGSGRDLPKTDTIGDRGLKSVHGTRTAPPAYFNWVDALRGIAAAMIVVFHYHHFFLTDYTSRPQIPDVSTFPYASILSGVYSHGALAVEFFWVISGFVFMHVYRHRKITFAEFWLFRIARLYPLHVATLLSVAALQMVNWWVLGTWQIYGNNDLRHFLLQVVFASNWSNLSRGLSFNGPIWSVSIELIAYMLFFVALGGLKRFGLPIAAGLCLLLAYLSGASWFDPPLLRKITLICASFFFCGSGLYFLFLSCCGRSVLILFYVVTLALISGLAFMWALPKVSLATTAATLILAAAYLDVSARFSLKGLSTIGEISYGLYLIHVPLQILFLTCTDLVAPGYRGFAQSYWLLPAYVIASFVLAHMSYRYLESPLSRYIRRQARRKRNV